MTSLSTEYKADASAVKNIGMIIGFFSGNH